MAIGGALGVAGEAALPATIAALLGVSFLASLLPVSRWNHRAIPLALAALGSLAIVALGALAILGGAPVTVVAGMVLGFAPVHVRFDELSGVFLVALGVVGAAASLFGIGYEAREAHLPDRTRAAFPVFLASLALVFGADDAFAFLFAWELMALSSAVLVVGARPSPAVARTGYLYLAITHIAAAALVIALAVLGSAAGSTDFAAMASAAPSMSATARSVVFILVLIGFATKAGAIPLHVWLPRAHPVAPSHVSAVMSGVMIKAGIYGVVRFGIDILGPGQEWWGLLVLGIGVASAVLGILYALMESDLKRLLAFSSIENVGIILIGLGVALVSSANGATVLGGLALAAALFHTLNHALFKSVMFLAAGSIEGAAGTRDLNLLGGLARVMPVTALAFGIGAAATAGVPPLNGFASEWMTFQALITTGGTAGLSLLARGAVMVAVAGLALSCALAVACFVKAAGIAFLALPRGPGAAAAREAHGSMGLAMAVLAFLCIALGVVAGPAAAIMSSVATAVMEGRGLGAQLGAQPGASPAIPVIGLGAAYATLPIAILLAAVAGGIWFVALRRKARRVPTWAGGMAPEAAFQYTATSYAKLVRLYFGPVLRPAREIAVELHPGTPFPRTIRYRSRVSHLIDERVYAPAHRTAVAVAQLIRRLQSGSLQLYLAYTVATLVVLLLVTR